MGLGVAGRIRERCCASNSECAAHNGGRSHELEVGETGPRTTLPWQIGEKRGISKPVRHKMRRNRTGVAMFEFAGAVPRHADSCRGTE
ncbi:hypothetical protein MGAST_05010 [Mycobacterium gastri 'Wayne']|uniref:Uncharacterized protein n=1 Tax=Mycobacterium gastri TaxID=1777 RepID=A0A1X1V4T0_MYCGS|nr:hypothetical protein MGAST_05010 [Mycobacterium gastri 'Wayne']ORV64106.1 hypothetical protein AWC07_15025 [Mycobacterium gastri]